MSRFINYEQSSIMHYKTIQQLINAYLGEFILFYLFYNYRVI